MGTSSTAATSLAACLAAWWLRVLAPRSLVQDIAAVRDAMLDAAGQAWQGAREATVDVMQYQYGGEVRGGAVAAATRPGAAACASAHVHAQGPWAGQPRQECRAVMRHPSCSSPNTGLV